MSASAVSSYFSLEAAEQLRQVGVFPGQRQNPLLRHGAVHVVVLQDHVFLQDFDGVNFVCAFQLRQHHLKTQGGSEAGAFHRSAA